MDHATQTTVLPGVYLLRDVLLPKLVMVQQTCSLCQPSAWACAFVFNRAVLHGRARLNRPY
jgi:hypothetical protein